MPGNAARSTGVKNHARRQPSAIQGGLHVAGTQIKGLNAATTQVMMRASSGERAFECAGP